MKTSLPAFLVRTYYARVYDVQINSPLLIQIFENADNVVKTLFSCTTIKVFFKYLFNLLGSGTAKR